jgi:hypothetical protein
MKAIGTVEPGDLAGTAVTTDTQAHNRPQSDDDCLVGSIMLDPESCHFYRHALQILAEAGVPFMVGGAFALERYTGIARHTKDFDVFIYRTDWERAMEAFQQAGYRSELTFPHWLGKAYCGDLFVDMIFSSGNGVAEVDDEWFANAVDDVVLGMPVKVCPPEEIIWSKTFVQERERFDGADVAHMLRACGPTLDWKRLARRYDDKWRVLFSHVIMFGFIYPGEQQKIPDRAMRYFMRRLQQELENPPQDKKLCQGTLVTRQQYLIDIDEWGYRDARLLPSVKMTQDDIDLWTEGIENDGKP